MCLFPDIKCILLTDILYSQNIMWTKTQFSYQGLASGDTQQNIQNNSFNEYKIMTIIFCADIKCMNSPNQAKTLCGLIAELHVWCKSAQLVAEWNVQYNGYSIQYNVPHMYEHRYTGWENILVRMSHRVLEWFTGIYLGVKMVHPRVSKSIRTHMKTSDTGYIQDSHYTITNYQTKCGAMNMGYYIGW